MYQIIENNLDYSIVAGHIFQTPAFALIYALLTLNPQSKAKVEISKKSSLIILFIEHKFIKRSIADDFIY